MRQDPTRYMRGQPMTSAMRSVRERAVWEGIRCLFPLVMIICSASAFAQDAQAPAPCSDPEFRQMDFWVGDWDLVWEGGKGRNVVTSDLGGCVITENFDGTPSSPLKGTSVSTYNKRSGRWQQTWVDNQGSYLDFTGGLVDSSMVLAREATIEGKTVHQRMVFYDIEPDALLWNWERSEDAGATWDVMWKIHYTRRVTE